MRRNKAIALSGWCIGAGISLAGQLSGWVWACNTLCLLICMVAGYIWGLPYPTVATTDDSPVSEFDAREWNVAAEATGFGAAAAESAPVSERSGLPPATLPAPTNAERLAERFALVARDARQRAE